MNRILLTSLLFIFACSTNDRLETALKMSGANRIELEKVLEHYSKDEADSLKLRAAKFLIENMPGHYTYGGEGLTSYIQQLDSLNPEMLLYTKGYFYSLYFNDPFNLDILTKEYDIEHVNADFLIKNIDYKFELLNILPFKDGITYDEFFDYLLPYRVDIEPLIDIEQDTLDNILANSSVAYNQLIDNDIFTRNSLDFVWRKVFFRNQMYIKTPNNLPYKMFGCDAVAQSNVEKFRLIGVPSTIDFVPHWGNSDGRHKWNNMIDGMNKSFTTSYINRSKIPKVYRKTYSPNPSPKYEGNLIPYIFNPFSKDVTSEYIRTAEVLLSYNECIKKNIKNVYLSVFNELTWQTVAWSAIDNKGNANFRDLGKGIVYLPIYYEGEDEIVNDVPFILTNNGSVRELTPNHENKISLRIERKYPYNEAKMEWNGHLIGSVVEAANNLAFNNPDTLYIMKNAANRSSYNISISNPKKYRYIRINKGVGNRVLFLSELFFINTYGEKVDYKPLLSDRPERGSFTAENELKPILSDNNFTTYTMISSQLMIDFDKSVEISFLNIGLRGDGNDVYPDNTYELMYHDKEGWVSMGVKTATDYFIEYDNVPSGALYWLRNLTVGKEERIFTYENEKMKFW